MSSRKRPRSAGLRAASDAAEYTNGGVTENRLAVAQRAAKLIAEGQTDYDAARHKAAKQLGMARELPLPSDREIHDALVQHHSLFARESQPRALRALREEALRLMHRLATFSPFLVGPVLDGTANEFSEIELELTGVPTKDFELYLVNAGVRFELCVPASAGKKYVTYLCEYAGAPVSIALFENHAARQNARGVVHLKNDRADLNEATRRFAV